VRYAAPSSDYRVQDWKIPRQSPRFSAGTQTFPHKKMLVHYKGRRGFGAFIFHGRPKYFSPTALNPRYWAPGWNSAQALNKYQDGPAGKLRAVIPERGFSNGRPHCKRFFQGCARAFSPRSGELLAVPLYHVFGSEELSIFSPAITQVSPKPIWPDVRPMSGILKLSKGRSLKSSRAVRLLISRRYCGPTFRVASREYLIICPERAALIYRNGSG